MATGAYSSRSPVTAPNSNWNCSKNSASGQARTDSRIKYLRRSRRASSNERVSAANHLYKGKNRPTRSRLRAAFGVVSAPSQIKKDPDHNSTDSAEIADAFSPT